MSGRAALAVLVPLWAALGYGLYYQWRKGEVYSFTARSGFRTFYLASDPVAFWVHLGVQLLSYGFGTALLAGLACQALLRS